MAEFIALSRLLLRPRHDAVVALDAGGARRHEEFIAAVSTWHSAFAAQPGPRCALYFEDSYAFAGALLGAWQAGKTVVLPGDAQPATLARLRREVEVFAGELPGALRPMPAAAPLPFDALPTDTPLLVLYTSGSSGEPLAIPKCLRQLEAEIATLEQLWGASLGEATVQGSVSHQHIYGLLFRVLWPLCAGRPFGARRLAYPEDMLAALAAPTTLVSSPAHLKRLPETLPWSTAQPQLRHLFSSGGPLPDEALAACTRLLGQAPVEVYGSSETGGIAARQRRHVNQGWEAFPGIALRIDDEGLLALRSPHLPDEAWWHTADRARWLDDGRFALDGRSDRLIKLEEKRVSLTALEQHLAASTLLDEARVLALDGARTQLGVVAVPSAAGRARLLAEGKAALNHALRAELAERVEPSALPRRWRYVDALPVNAQGKTPQALLAALFDPRRPDILTLRRDGASAQLQLRFGVDSPYFDGHFPPAPILPGVAQAEWAIRCGRELFALPADFLRLEALKFQQVIRPGAPLLLDLDYQAARSMLGFRLHSEAGVHASGRVVFAP